MTQIEFDALADQYEDRTGHMSFRHAMMRTAEFKRLTEAGDKIVPLIIADFGSRKRWGMHWHLVLECITHERPLQPELSDGFEKWDVDATCQAWIDWFDRKWAVPRFQCS